MENLIYCGCLIILILVMLSLGVAIIEKVKLDRNKDERTIKE